ncbi:MAG TPA: hypothetical protein VF572_04500 [Candidatus Saccharimonadales bacterium]|jgi:hypothetical protein
MLNFIGRFVRSQRCFYAVILLLILQALWIALTARYPQAFDENYHLGLIRLHTQQWLPFFTSQPPDSSVYGAIVRDPSYLYHYLMAVPYQMLRFATDSLTAQVIGLRLINIGIFVGALFIYRKLFDELGISRALRNVTLLFFVLLPVVPQLAGQINYDNLMVLLTALLFLYGVRYYRWVTTASAGSPLPIVLILQIILTGCIGSIVKFPFAPIFFALAILLAMITVRRIRRQKSSVINLLEDKDSVPAGMSKLKLVGLALFTAVSIGLCIERYGVNMVQYQAPVPKCDMVLSIDECQKYSPWARDHLFAATYPEPTALGIAVYPWVWVHRTVYETMFSITSYIDDVWGTVTYKPYQPLTIVNYTGWTVLFAGGLLAAVFRRHIWRNRGLVLLLAVSAFYLLVLFVQNFSMYLHTGEAVAIHGRYLVPLYPVLLVVLAIGFARFFDRERLATYRNLFLVVVLLLFLQGGGIVGWIIYSDASWYLQQNYAAERANWLAKNVLTKVVHH